MSSTVVSSSGESTFVDVNSISYTSKHIVLGRGKKKENMLRGNVILQKLCYYLNVSPLLCFVKTYFDIVFICCAILWLYFSYFYYTCHTNLMPRCAIYCKIHCNHMIYLSFNKHNVLIKQYFNNLTAITQPQHKCLKRGMKNTMVNVSLVWWTLCVCACMCINAG